jgi:hypothetical protein
LKASISEELTFRTGTRGLQMSDGVEETAPRRLVVKKKGGNVDHDSLGEE